MTPWWSPTPRIVGLVVAVQPGPEPAIYVRSTPSRRDGAGMRLRATFARSQPQASITGERARFSVGYDGAIRPAGGIPLFTSDAPAAAGAINLPAGARLHMVLTDSLAVRALVPTSGGPAPAP